MTGNSAPAVRNEDWFENRCRTLGLRITPQRRAIYRALAASTAHPNVEEIRKVLRESFPNLSPDTIYRTLSTFAALEIIRRVEVPEGPARFDANLEPHHHFICIRCHMVGDFTWPAFEELSPPPGISNLGTAGRRVAVIHGICRNCREQEQD